MTDFEKFDPGTFAWVDVNTTDPEATRAFFTSLFGLTSNDVPSPTDTPYTIMMKDGKQAWGLFPLQEDLREAGVPSHFLSYVKVSDVAATLAAMEGAGGSTAVAPMDVGNGTWIAMGTDPTGAMIGLMQPGDEEGVTVANEPGTLIWNELLTNDCDGCAAFYSTAFGWALDSMDTPNGPYHSFKDGDDYRGGMMEIRQEWGPLPPSWQVYFATDDADATVAKAEQLGGSVAVPAFDVPEVGRMATLADPAGAHFSVFQPSTPVP